ncbi:MAG: hypothetical protein HY369_03305 [Candidatus Aenigmarchaeota archaeon]|nr:hypothetical protein [Candidatus Aenigmarchaeota archaeon]
MKALLLVAVLLVSGCTASGTGVVIEDFVADFSTVFVKEPVGFQVQVRNTGSQDSPGGEVRLLGLDDWSGQAQPCTVPGLLAGPPGEVFTCPTATLTAPDVPQGITVTYRPVARLAYSYTSTLLSQITVGTQDELRRIEQGGGTLPLDASASSASPILVTAKTQGPLRVFSGSVTFPLEITVTNQGGGVACKGDFTDCLDHQKWNALSFTTQIAGQKVDDCSRSLTITQGSNTIVCQATLTDIPSTGVLQKTISIQSTYGYFVDREIPVTVAWRPA